MKVLINVHLFVKELRIRMHGATIKKCRKYLQIVFLLSAFVEFQIVSAFAPHGTLSSLTPPPHTPHHFRHPPTQYFNFRLSVHNTNQYL